MENGFFYLTLGSSPQARGTSTICGKTNSCLGTQHAEHHAEKAQFCEQLVSHSSHTLTLCLEPQRRRRSASLSLLELPPYGKSQTLIHEPMVTCILTHMIAIYNCRLHEPRAVRILEPVLKQHGSKAECVHVLGRVFRGSLSVHTCWAGYKCVHVMGRVCRGRLSVHTRWAV